MIEKTTPLLDYIKQYDDEALLRLMQTDEQRVFTEIYNRYWDKLYYVAYNRLQSEDEAENVVQDVFCTFWRKRGQLNIQSLGFYLSAMTRHAVYEQLAKRKRRSEIENNALAGTQDLKELTKTLDNKNLLETISAYARELPQKCSMVFIHNKLLDLPLSEVAKMMNISEKTAETHLTKALKIIREQMKKTSLLNWVMLIIFLAAKGLMMLKDSFIRDTF